MHKNGKKWFYLKKRICKIKEKKIVIRKSGKMDSWEIERIEII
jgi:hypothetical protein